MVGGFSQVDQAQIANLRNDPMLSKAEEEARKAYRERNNGELGNMVELYQQVVAGINYKMIFQTENGNYEVLVFAQPWTETYKVLEMNPVINNQWFNIIPNIK